MARNYLLWFPWLAAVVLVAAPLGPRIAAAEPLRDVIDRHVRAAWQHENIVPASQAGDAEFLRRIFLDLVGTIPTSDEATAFFNDTSSDKRSKLIDKLLDDPRYARHQAEIWDVILFTRNPPGSEAERRDGIQAWLRKQFEQNVPYDDMVRALLKAEGNSVDDGPPLYLVQYRSRPEDATEAITQTFLGVQLQCARCHNHPYEPWTQHDFYGMAAFVARLQVVSVGKAEQLTKYMIAEKSTGDVLFTGPAKDARPGAQGDPVKPKFLHGDELAEPPLPEGFKEVKLEDNKLPPPPFFSRKDQLAMWITRPDNPYFARAAANRFWAQYMGRGLVHPVDNMSASNPPTHPELLDALAKWLVEQKFDLKALVRELCNSQAYQLSSAGGDGEVLPRWFERGRVRPLSAEELVDAWRTATGYEFVEKAAGKKQGGRFHPLEGGYVLRFFGQPNNGAGDFQGGLQEHLYLNNGPLSQLITSSKGGLLDELSSSQAPLETRVDRLFLAVLTRPPNPAERQKFTEYLGAEQGRQERLRDAIWALMTCSEFRFNH